MIRREEKNSFWLFTQHDHAVLSGQLAQYLGNAQFAPPDPLEPTLIAITQHDCGWPIHDNHPTLSPAQLPLDVFETPRQIAHKVWIESARRAATINPYAGLLVALHVLSLSAASVSTNQPSRFDIQQMRQQFDLNKFQHQAIELLEQLRPQVGLRVDRPLRLGLAEGWTDENEEKLKHNFRLLQAMDLLSLAICCTTPPENMSGPVHPHPGAATIKLQLHRPDPHRLLIKPWPFTQPRIELSIPYKSLPKQAWNDESQFRSAYAQAPTGNLQIEISAE